MGAALEALGGGLHAKYEIWQDLPFALQFTTCSALLEGFNSFAKHKAVKLQKLNPCNEILLPPFSQSCQNNDVFMVFYLMCEISSSQIWIKAFCAIYPLKRILSRFLLIDRNYNFRRWVVKLLFTLEWTAQGDKGSARKAQKGKMFYVLLHHGHSTSCLI